MNLNFDRHLINQTLSQYKSNAQIARLLTESWVLNNSYCPNCGHYALLDFPNNSPVADFYCPSCDEEYELKSKQGNVPSRITDGAYHTMLKRIHEDNNPNLFFMNYTKDWSVKNFMIIPKYFFIDKIIVKRKPLSTTARRAGWIGCDINIGRIPQIGKIFIVQDSNVTNPQNVVHAFHQSSTLVGISQDVKSWLLDILICIDKINKVQFSLQEVYSFEPLLKQQYPNNNHIKAKIRQQLQILRQKGFIEFLGKGQYRKLSPSSH